MRYVKWTLLALIALTVFSFLHYTLPQNDIVRIVGTENRRIDFGENSIFWAQPDVGTAGGGNRDVFFVQTVQPDGKPMVYRNEDTGWGWPPYFKLDSSNTQAEAQALVSTAEAPKWVAITHYGWRNEFFTIFPNAVSVKQVESPDVRIIPWVNIIILTTLLFILFLLWRMWAQFRERTIDPALEDVAEAMDAAGQRVDQAQDRAAGVWGRFRAWLNTWRAKPRK
ncbi:DUF1523 family protein [Aliigemmobacter aestuarii]|uniref:DUF1523 family protein n=1 Tax=Aliigemmobacter aestuarii TaxID=1445661 RepID=A0A4S3MNT2_9RHOB|nr:DUF1523 family protein [Gemmobacter aestuarii]THD83593.1 DUF1523 family protein [Gemmobacter aestuarii]